MPTKLPTLTTAPCRGRRRILAAAVAAAGASACRPGHALMAGAAPDTPSRRVDPNTPLSRWTSAVAVTVDGGVYSGVIIAPRYVLTAAHVAGGAPAERVRVQVNSRAQPVVIRAASVVSFPGANFPYDDLALIELERAVPADVRILPIYRSKLEPGQPITLVGYGASGRGDSGVSVGALAGVKRRGRNVVDDVQARGNGHGPATLFYFFDFDGPTGFGPLGGPSLGNAIEAGLAAGDSGSPAYADIAGRTWLVGINNHVAPRAGERTPDFRFGSRGGGLLLADPRVLAWLDEQTHGTAY